MDSRIVHSLFGCDTDGQIPLSPMQFNFGKMDKRIARNLNEDWHSRLPDISNWQNCDCYSFDYCNIFYAIAMWSIPSSASLNGRNWYELRRMAIHDDAPRNTASRMLSLMRKQIQIEKPYIKKLISYQDTESHHGTIYKASNWYIGHTSKGDTWSGRKGRDGRTDQSTAIKIRWEYDLK